MKYSDDELDDDEYEADSEDDIEDFDLHKDENSDEDDEDYQGNAPIHTTTRTSSLHKSK